uniref:Putative ovule protein n=1 Tax=Solanum chacoense TaxID=4108 RepID=A0A0V0H774_SOLCH
MCYVVLSLLICMFSSLLYLLFHNYFDMLHFELRVFWKQPLYLHEVGVRSTYTLPSSDSTCGITLDQ